MALPIAVIVGATGASGGTNAGTGSANGTYIQVTGGNSTYNGVAQYTNGTDFLIWNGSPAWQIWTGVNATGTELYDVNGGSTTSIPSSNWFASSGISPGPTLALVTTGLAVSYIATGAGTSSVNGTYLPLSGSNAIYSGVTQYSNATDYISWNSNQWNVNATVNTVGASALYAPTTGVGTTFPLTGWSTVTGTSPVPTFTSGGGTAPTAPSTLTLVDNTPTSINVTIPALSGGATSYTLQRAPDVSGSPGTYSVLNGGSAVTPSSIYSDTGLTPNTIYWYILVATNSYGSTNGVGSSIITLNTPPTGVTATYVARVGILVSWTAPVGVSPIGYNLYKLNGALTNGVPQLVNTGERIYIPSNLTSIVDFEVGTGFASVLGSNTFTYYMTAVSSNGTESTLSSASNAVTFSG